VLGVDGVGCGVDCVGCAGARGLVWLCGVGVGLLVLGWLSGGKPPGFCNCLWFGLMKGLLYVS
jgi:hypothetical protein